MHVKLITTIAFLAVLLVCASAKQKWCGEKLMEKVDQVCTFANEKTPCTKDGAHIGRFKRDQDKQEGEREHDDDRRLCAQNFCLFAVVKKCCDDGCKLEDIQKLCCFTTECLNACYPNRKFSCMIVE